MALLTAAVGQQVLPPLVREERSLLEQPQPEVRAEAATSIGGVKAVPAVRAMAKKMFVDQTKMPRQMNSGITDQAISSAMPPWMRAPMLCGSRRRYFTMNTTNFAGWLLLALRLTR